MPNRKTTSQELKTQTALRLDPKLLKEIDKVAEMQRTSRTSIIEQCLDAGLPRLRDSIDQFRKGK